jgi:ribosomal protein S27E
MARTGICHICGQHGPLSFEHVPPRAAFNDRAVAYVKLDDSVTFGPDAPHGRIQQKGMGSYTLCERCNNLTGKWYAASFAKWCHDGMALLASTGGKASLVHLNHVLPLRIIKQIVVMFFSINGPGFQAHHPELVRFVLNREARFLPPKYHFYVYFNWEGTMRMIAGTGLYHLPTRRMSIMWEISCPPYGYVMTIDSPPPDDRLVDIRYFSNYGYNDFRTLPLKLPVLPTHLVIPGDYRTKEQILAEAVSPAGTSW